jgi:hypothetical protein
MNFQKSLLILVLSFTSFVYGQEGNYKFNNFGNRSILLVGNVTGSVSDIGLTYYNPSFLTDVENVGFSLNAKAYQLVNVKLESPVYEDTQLNNTVFNSASTMAGGVFNLLGTKFAYSYLTKSNLNFNINYNTNFLSDKILDQFPETVTHNAKIRLNSQTKDDWTGLSWAYRFSNAFSVGISVFGSVYNYNGFSNLSHTLESSSNDVTFYQNSVSFKQKSYGLFSKIGANYHFTKFDLGININLPYLSIINDGRFVYSKTIAGVNAENNTFIDTYFKDLPAIRKEPLGISIGAGIPVKNGKIHLNLDYVNGLKKYDRISIPDIDIGDGIKIPVNFDEERRAVFNVGVGAELELYKNLKAYGGFSTDFNAFKNNANIFDISSDKNKQINIGDDFYHMSGGIDWKLSWISIISGITYTKGSNSFVSPYQIDFGNSTIDNNLNSKLSYSRWQFVIGIDIPVLNRKIEDIGIK